MPAETTSERGPRRPVRPGRVGILFLGGARRVTMARMMRRAASSLGLRADIFSYELDSTVPIASEATVITGLKWSDPGLMAHLSEVIGSNGIDIVVPFVDGAVAVASRVAASGMAYAPVGDETGATEMFDKVIAATRFAEAGLPVPATWAGADEPRGLIAKPRLGSASKGIVKIDCRDDLLTLPMPREDYLIQRRYDRREEYTVDCFRTVIGGTVTAVSPRLRLEVLGGEVSRTVTVDAPDARELARRVLMDLDLRGAVTVQLLRDLDSGCLMVMEVNPRPGGGAVCSVYAGADLPRMILSDALGLDVAEAFPRPGVEIARYFAETVFEGGRMCPSPL